MYVYFRYMYSNWELMLNVKFLLAVDLVERYGSLYAPRLLFSYYCI